MFAADGSPIGEEFAVTTTRDNQTESKVVPLANGGFVATWVGWAGDPPKMHIVSQQFNASGGKVGPEEILNPDGGGNPSGPSVSTHGSGYVISWTDGGRALARFFNTDGTPAGGEVAIDDVDYTSDLSVNTLSDGSLIFSWLRQEEGERSYVAQKYDGQGQKVGAEILIQDFSVFGNDIPVIATLENGTFLAAWARWDGENQISTIVTQLFDQYGQKAGPEHRAYSSSAYIEELALTTASDGRVFVSWTSHGEEDTDVRSLVLGPAADSINRAPIVSGTTSLPNGAEDNPVVITKAQLLGNASDPDGDLLWIVDLSVTDGGGSLVDNGDGTWTYSPPSNQHGIVSFSYGVTDGALTTATTATVNIAAQNEVPDVSGSTSLPDGVEDNPVVITEAQLLGNASDPDGDVLSVVDLMVTDGGGSLVDNGDGTWTYSPPTNQHGVVSFSYGVTDGALTTATTATLSMAAQNDAPNVIGATSLPSGAEDYPVIITKAQLLGNASDPDGDALSVVDLKLTGEGGSLVDTGNDIWIYRPSSNQHGTVSFSYGVTDGALTTATTATLGIAARNDAPGDIGLVGGSVDENSKAGITVGVLSGFDVDGDTLTFSLVSGGDGRYAVEGNKIVVANGSLLDFEQRSSDQIRIRASDSAGSSFEKTFTVTLNDVASETVAGGSSSDVITGGNGTDKLNGGAGNDDVRGGAGNDYLSGGAGKDTLRGDSGKDYFVFDTKLNAKTNVDKIVDFIVKDDTFLIDNLFFKAIGKGTASKPGKLNSDMFVIGTKAKDAEDRIIYDNKKGYLYYDADGTGSSKAILFATLSKKLKMAAADFLVIWTFVKRRAAHPAARQLPFKASDAPPVMTRADRAHRESCDHVANAMRRSFMHPARRRSAPEKACIARDP